MIRRAPFFSRWWDGDVLFKRFFEARDGVFHSSSFRAYIVEDGTPWLPYKLLFSPCRSGPGNRVLDVASSPWLSALAVTSPKKFKNVWEFWHSTKDSHDQGHCYLLIPFRLWSFLTELLLCQFHSPWFPELACLSAFPRLLGKRISIPRSNQSTTYFAAYECPYASNINSSGKDHSSWNQGLTVDSSNNSNRLSLIAFQRHFDIIPFSRESR